MPAEKAFICVAGELAEPVADVQAQTPVVRLDISANADMAGKWVGIIDGYWSVAPVSAPELRGAKGAGG
ncbi:hypothetical protein [Streptomyces sp. NBC_00847]|uniref:hypothetical protein n=1 Tax=Streptomyces sp. NBC_00847 TaxID=2975850 RepID=UPI0022520333|nr:hypothetical protein [Streptomyces sp. NBC_00847]MCX4884424.1 hypothetical protein [Streptomyces sp. NBC_00847]